MSDDGLEDGGVWEDRALLAESDAERLREAIERLRDVLTRCASDAEEVWYLRGSEADAYNGLRRVANYAREALGDKP